MRVQNILDESELEFYADGDEPKIETCDVYATHGNPDGNEHHACLDQLFSGDGFSVQDSYTTSIEQALDVVLDAVSSEKVSFEQYGRISTLFSEYSDSSLTRHVCSKLCSEPESISTLVTEYLARSNYDE